MSARERRVNRTLRRLVLTGSLMAQTLRDYADELDRSSGVDPKRQERALANTWESYLKEFRHEQE